jgi:hypothetical protein
MGLTACLFSQIPFLRRKLLGFTFPEPFYALRINSAWETLDPGVISWNLVIRTLDKKVELIRSTIFTVTSSQMSRFTRFFLARKMNSNIVIT